MEASSEGGKARSGSVVFKQGHEKANARGLLRSSKKRHAEAGNQINRDKQGIDGAVGRKKEGRRCRAGAAAAAQR